VTGPAFTSALTGWFAASGRALPFRGSRDPYRIWVSEIMAQQTRMTAVTPYFERFVAVFPTVQALAAAPEEAVLSLWAGLGYYGRARNLHRAARLVCEQYGGALPRDVKALRALPGVGAYTAGAIASIAFGLPAPAVDGNVLRVFARVTGNCTDVRLPEMKCRAAAWVLAHMPPEDPGALTEALMELGALVCVPGNPRCGGCPVRAGCEGYRTGAQQALPVLSPRPEKRVEPRRVLLLRGPDGRFLLRRRTERLLRGQWEFPTPQDAAQAGVVYTERGPAGTERRVFTHLIWELEGVLCDAPAQPAPEGWRWLARDFSTLKPMILEGPFG
jgi:A/G-specific adenine glycosylase